MIRPTHTKSYLTVLLIFITISLSYSQSITGTIAGKVRTSDGAPAELVTVLIKGIASTTTNKNGEFTLKNIPSGKHTLTARLIGVKPVSRETVIRAGEAIDVELVLAASDEQLQEVVVSGSRTNKFAVKESQYVSKMPLKNLENPQVYSVVSSELIKEQVITTFDDALKNAPGVDKLWSSTGRAGDGAGYFSLRGFAVQPTLINGLPGLTNGALDVANIERIEVIKGPSGTLFGSSVISYGGLINTVTKKPFDTFAAEVNYTAGSFGLNRAAIDLNSPLDAEKKLLFRVNAAWHDENSFQDAGLKRNRYIAPSLTYRMNDRLSFEVNAEFLSTKNTNAAMLFFNRAAPLLWTNLDQVGYNPENSFTSNDLTIKNPITTFQGQINYKISDHWTSQTLVSAGSAKSDGYYSYLYERGRESTSTDQIFDRYINRQDAETHTTDIQQNFIGDFNIGQLRNRLVVGLDYFNRRSKDNSSAWVADGAITTDGNDTGNLTPEGVDALIAAADAAVPSDGRQQVFSAYASDVINFTPQLSAMLSLRIDRFKNGGETVSEDNKYEQTAWSPKFGLVYQPVLDKLSLFANYLNGFANVAPVTSGGVVTVFDPEQANQWEVGVKTNLMDGKITGTLSYYDIRVTDKVRQIAMNEYVQDGENYSRGISFDFITNPIEGLNILAGYNYNNSKITQTGVNDYAGRRPEEAGPKHTANAWVSYKFLKGAIKGFGLGFGGNYAGENQILNRATTGIFTLPSYTVLNASASYGFRKWNLIFKLDNLTDKEYYKGWSTIEPMRPRSFAVNLGYKF
ncbi:TonB-dependent siderophore receptor [Arcticibacter tournemirensis]|uniref:TonB-dependent siderophore receptor n=1 Tax=Arcticibacter tournemirensis TaxID=699437 RepID=A0A4Q0MAY5_9SPHI|nr:TonB-dependent siderophore receptor [Arcticibacter tournemirensis]